MAVLFVPILDALFRSRPLTPNTVGSVVLALSGVALLQNAASFSAGDFTSLLQALFFGIGYFRLEAVSQRYPTSTARVLSGELWGTTLLALLYMMITDGIGIGSSVMGFPEILANVSNWLTDPSTLFAILWTGLISTSLALYLETAALTVLPASEVTILMTTISIWGSAFAYVLFGEVLGISGWMGGLLILAGCLLNTIPSKENMDNGLKSETTSTTASTSSIPIKMD
jgi:drug/metabolite transporter (DMT)-like permease